MDPDRPPRKVKFAPKAPRRPTPKPTSTQIDVAEDDGDDEQSQQSLMRRVNEHLTRRGKKVEKKSPVQVAFEHGVASTAIRTFGKQRERTDNGSERTYDGSDAPHSKRSPISEKRDLFASTSAVGTGVGENAVDLTETEAETMKKKKEYREPWDYLANYPITLPLRRPNSGDPELLDKAEFEEALEYDENSLSTASYLGLQSQDVDDEKEQSLLFFKFPSKLPLVREQTETSRRETDDNLKVLETSVTNQKGKVTAGSVSRGSGMSTGRKGKETTGSSSGPVSVSGKECSLEELPEGYLGKMLVYKSGAVKLKLGEMLYDVSPGSDCAFTENVMAINTTNKQCCDLGSFKKRIVVTPDIDSLLDNAID